MTAQRIFELRTYHPAPGKMSVLERRFQDHTTRIFARMGMELVALLLPTADDAPLVYLLAFESREDADERWKKFKADPEWIAVKTASEADGPLLARQESQFLTAAPYSPLH